MSGTDLFDDGREGRRDDGGFLGRATRHDDREYDDRYDYEDEGTDYYERFSARGRRGTGSSGSGSGDGGGRRGGGSRRRRGRSLVPALVLLVVLAIIVGVGVVGFGKLRDHFAAAPDYPGPGSGQVTFQVAKGESVAGMGRDLRAKGVVKSVDAFMDAARQDDRASTIQVGYYRMKKQMKATDALAVLVDPKNLVQTAVTIPEGARVRNIVDTIVAKTDFTKAQVTAALKRPARIGLPAAAKSNPEGYLFPATYTVTPDMDATGLLRQMVAKTVAVEKDLDLVAQAKAVNLTPEQVLTVASILEYEANRKVDYPKVARVIYNRLNAGMPLQLDSTVTYVSKREGDVWTTAAERASDSKYNTYDNAGLPPGPIGSPGKDTIEAALKPAKGDWLYFLPDFEKGTTLFFATDGPERRAALDRLKTYCQTHESC